MAPSWTAAIGGTRVARRAGPITAATVTTTPTTSAATMVRGRTSMPAAGSPKPIASNSRRIPHAMPMPARRPTTDAITPMTSASPTTLVITCERVAPSVRIIPNSRTRWATVIEKVLKMMNAPTKSATPANASSAGVRKPEISPAMSSLWAWAFSAAVSTSRSAGRTARMRLARSFSLTPGSAVAKTLVTWSSRSNQRCASPRVTRTTVAPPIDSTSP